MNLPARAEFPDRPTGTDALAQVSAALDIASRFFRACSLEPDINVLSSPPLLHICSIHGLLTFTGAMMACDRLKPFGVVGAWGQWLFVTSGGEGRNVEFLGNSEFMDGLVLGSAWQPANCTRIQLFPVLATGTISLPEPVLYRYLGERDPAGHAAREAEWRSHFERAALLSHGSWPQRVGVG